MTSFSDNYEKPDTAPRLVVFVVYPDIVLLDLSGPLQVFSHALASDDNANGYECAVVSLDGGTIQTNTIVPISTEPMGRYANRKIHTLIIVGGGGANVAMNDQTLLENIRQLSLQAKRVCSVCSGALVLAATGLLDGRRAVTHWEDCETLEREFPQVQVEMDPIYIKDDRVWTSAGITAGIDMALAIVAEDLGRPAALAVARSMVTQMARSGGQSQFSPALDRQLSDTAGMFEDLHRWIADNLQSNLQVDVLADRMNMSSRNFSRTYSRQMQITPAKAVEVMRTEAAKELLEATNMSIKQIATKCGFNDEERMRRAFMRMINVSPSDYRQCFKAI